jgi:hypothetical protein
VGTWRLRDALLDPRTLVVPFLLYGVARAATLAITHDEALTYLFHVRAPWAAVLAHTAPLPSNNHLLNTAAVKALLTLLPPTELVLRLPALAGMALFLWAASRIAALVTTGWRRPLGFLLLAANPLVLDLLVLSRGYALALGLALVAVALELGAIPQRPAARHALAALCAATAVLANLSLAHTFAGIAAAAALLALASPTAAPVARASRPRPPDVELTPGVRAGRPQHKGSCARDVLAAVAPFALGTLALAVVYRPSVLARIRRPLADWGGERGIWADTVPSLADAMVPKAAWAAPWHGAAVALLTALAAAIVLAATLALALPAARRALTPEHRRALAFGITFCGAWSALAWAANVLLGARFPIERGAAFLVPTATLLLLTLWEAAAQAARPQVAASRCLAAAAALVLTLFAAGITPRRSVLWPLDADMRAAMRAVASFAAGAPPASVRLGVSWQLEPAANFYRVTRGIAGLAPVTREDPRSGFDLYLLIAAYRALGGELRLRTCAELPLAGTVLAAAPGLPCPQVR